MKRSPWPYMLCTFLLIGSMLGQEPTAKSMPGVITSPRPTADLLLLLSQKTGLVYHYEDPFWLFEGDAEDPDRGLNRTGSPPHFPVPRASTLRIEDIRPRQLTTPRFTTAALKQIFRQQGISTGALADFDVIEKDGTLVVIPVRVRDAAGKLTSISSLMDQVIHLPSSSEPPSERLAAICRLISSMSGRTVKPAPPPRFDMAYSGGSALQWPAAQATARDLLLQFLSSAPRPYFYHLYCQPAFVGSEGFCVLNVAPLMVEVETDAGQRVLRTLR